ncbi:Vacuolar ATP synthase subunit C [Mucor velutinosus]|uniref:Vacuolar ATP synthase subunit C n=1 Tax=Mucor velutinosus TaxID=708070 RepID=A0AAN7I109_9FUNG|nr:Vacuolar ATP synthase subunit C [Mucor velutinosus]
MLSQKSQTLFISSLLVSVLIGVSSALGINETTSSARTPPKAYLDPIVENKLVRQSCLPVNGTDTLDCSFYFDAKKHSLLYDPSNCLVFGYYRYPPLSSQRNGSCQLKFPANACIQSDLSWLSVCFEVYYADTLSLDRRSNFTTPKPLVDNLKIGSFQTSSANFTDVAVFLAETDGFTAPVGFTDV